MISRSISLLVSCFLLFVACKNDKPAIEEPGKITSFYFAKEHNLSIIDKDISTVIDGYNIHFEAPDVAFIQNLVASFEFTGTSVKVNGTSQVSGQTANNFSESISYDVLGKDGKTVSYRVQATLTNEESLVFNSFSLQENINEQLTQDIVLSLKDDSLLAKTALSGSKKLIPTFTTNAQKVLLNGSEVTSGETVIDFSEAVHFILVNHSGFRKEYIVKVNWLSGIPHIYISTHGGVDIMPKETWRDGNIIIEGMGIYEDFESAIQVRGRGNSTWGYPKKPYRFRLPSGGSAPLFGLGKARNWVLLANYLDETLMLNSVALKTGQLLEMPYTNHFVPVDVTINGTYKGSYLFTEHVQANPNRVDVEEAGGMLLELDSYFDEDFKFKSNQYNLPINIKFPELNTQSEVAAIQSQFQQFEDLLSDASGFPNNNYLDYFDKTQLVNFLIVFALTDNGEINHPKSVYMHKKAGGKFTMGPIWDFDWAYGFNESQVYHFMTARNPTFRPGNEIGTQFFQRFLQDPEITALYKQKWTDFKTNKFPELMTFVDEYAKLIRESHLKDYNANKNIYPAWRRSTASTTFDADVTKLKKYLTDRVAYLDGYVNGL